MKKVAILAGGGLAGLVLAGWLSSGDTKENNHHVADDSGVVDIHGASNFLVQRVLGTMFKYDGEGNLIELTRDYDNDGKDDFVVTYKDDRQRAVTEAAIDLGGDGEVDFTMTLDYPMRDICFVGRAKRNVDSVNRAKTDSAGVQDSNDDNVEQVRKWYNGNLIEITNYVRGKAVKAKTFEYDVLGNLTKIIDSDGKTWTPETDDDGKAEIYLFGTGLGLVKEEVASVLSSPEFDKSGKSSVTNIFERDWEHDGEVDHTNTYTSEYDSKGRTTRTTRGGTDRWGGVIPTKVSTFKYDPWGTIVERTGDNDGDGKVDEFWTPETQWVRVE